MIPVLCGSKTEAWLQALNAAAQQPRYTAELDPQSKVAVFAGNCTDQLQAFPKLVWAHCTYAGIERALSQTEVPIARLIDPQLSKRMAQSVLTACLNWCQQTHLYATQQRAQSWQPQTQWLPHQCQVLLLGAGELGQACAHQLRALGFKVASFSRRAKSLPWPHFSRLGPEVIGGADVVVNLLPSTAQTQHFVNADFLSSMKPSAALVNVGRGHTVDSQALLHALDRRQLSYAVLDVFEVEPLEDPIIWDHPHIEVWPHIAANTQIDTAALIINRAIERYLDDGSLPKLVDRQRGY
ncbi:MAG: NAD(P)-dependent oxidoreductase [Litorivicinus sp.]